MVRFESSLVKEVSTEVSLSCFLSISAQSSLGLFLASFPERISHLLPVMLVLFLVLPGMLLLCSADILSIPNPNPKASLVLLFFALPLAISLNFSPCLYVFSCFLSAITCFYQPLCWSHCSHIYVKCLCIVSGYTIRVLQNF